MSEFNISYRRTPIQNKIMDLEKKYMDILENIFTSPDFLNDLKRIEKETQTHYDFLTEVWGKKNKIKEASERLVRHHIYKNFDGSFYSSPVSCDIAIELEDIILNVDIKTIDKIGNGGELSTTQFEHNQTSFINIPVEEDGFFPGFRIKSNLQSIDSNTNKPVLTYLIKIAYADDGNGYFSLINDRDVPSLILTCLPNGQLSNLFDSNLFSNFKNYKYYSHTNGNYYKPRKIEYSSTFNVLTKNDKFNLIENKTNIPSDWNRLYGGTKVGYYDSANSVVWYVVPRKKNGLWITYLEAVEGGDTARFNDEWLKKRYDSKNSPWLGQRKYYQIY